MPKKLTGRAFEADVLGDHEKPIFPVQINSSFWANFITAVTTHVKGHDPYYPTDPKLVLLKKGIGLLTGSSIALYNCVGLPIDLLHATDMLVVDWRKKSFVIIDLKGHETDHTDAHVVLAPDDFHKERLDIFCQRVARMLSEANRFHAIPEEVCKQIPDHLKSP